MLGSSVSVLWGCMIYRVTYGLVGWLWGWVDLQQLWAGNELRHAGERRAYEYWVCRCCDVWLLSGCVLVQGGSIGLCG